MAEWATYRAEPFNPAEVGVPDPDIYPLVDALNALPGICTVQSCAGHVRASPLDGADVYWPAHLWIRASETVLRAFQAHVWRLMEYDGIERCAVLYHPTLGDLIDLQFAGNERGRLAESSDWIRRFFVSVAAVSELAMAVSSA